jgi:serine/threonine protein kinase
MLFDDRILEILMRWEVLHQQGRAIAPEELCRDCPDLFEDVRQRVEDLLAWRPLLDDSPPTPDDALPTAGYCAPAETEGACIGPYKLMRLLGEGGMGTVWLAHQVEPIRRDVALKFIKSGIDSAQVFARFEQEREALALMDHPNIAKVLDAGTVAGAGGPPWAPDSEEEDTGPALPTTHRPLATTARPYFVLEYVKGVPITTYCDQERLTARERLELFIPVCQAVQHAHQKGIIHRDLKPSNVLVTLYDHKPVPKVIDFGVAKATARPLTQETVFTELGQIIGTLEYMAPEQAELSNIDIDTRADIYSLGVMLYELLTGSPPFTRKQLRSATFSEMLRLIREVNPPRPSTRLSASAELSTIAARRRSEPRRLTRQVYADLDWVVMKCLEKERSRRYESAAALATDLRRYLNVEPVLAGPPSAAYRMRKLLRRHRAVALAASLALFTLVMGILGTSWGWVTATQARNAEAAQRKEAEAQQERAAQAEQRARTDEARARTSEGEAKAVLGFFQDKVLAAARPKGQSGGLGREATIASAIAAAESQIEKAFADQPLVEAAIRDTLGNTYIYLGQPQQAVHQLEKARTLRQTCLGPDDPDTLDSISNLAYACYHAGQTDEAIALYEDALKRTRACLGPNHPVTLNVTAGLGLTYRAVSRLADAVPLLEEALKRQKDAQGADDPATLDSADNLARVYIQIGRSGDAVEILEPVVELMKKRLGADHHDTLLATANLGAAYRETGQPAKALALHEQTVRLMKAQLGPDHPDTLNAMGELAKTEFRMGRQAEALRLLEETLALNQGKYGSDHPYTFFEMQNLASAYAEAGRTADAMTLFEKTLRLRKLKLGPDHPETVRTTASLARLHMTRKEYALAEPLLVEALARTRQREGNTSATTGALEADLGDCLLHENKFAEAEALMRARLAVGQHEAPEDWLTFRTRSLLGGALLGQKKCTQAEALLVQGYEGMKEREAKIPKGSRIYLTEALERLLRLADATGKKGDALKWQRELDDRHNSVLHSK